MSEANPDAGTESAGRRTARGRQTRQEILKVAVDLASAEGLEGLTIGRLAKALRMSKSGLIAHFGSKEELQLAAVDTARAVFVEEIIQPARATERGIDRLRAMLEGWLGYVERSVFRGGCFFAAASAEFDDRPGPVRDQVAALTGAWLQVLQEEVREAQARAQLDPALDAAQLVFELHAFVQEANWAYRLLGDPRAFTRARAAIARALGHSANEKRNPG